MNIGGKFGRTIGFLFLLSAILVFSDTALAGGGSWGSGGSWGGGSWGSGGSFGGSSGGGSWGSRGGGIAYRTPVRNLLGNIHERAAYRRSMRVAGGSGSWGSSGGSGGSTGSGSFGSSGGSYVSTGGSWGSSYATTASGASYGSWGSSYVNTIDTSYSVPSNVVDYGYMDAGVISNEMPIGSSTLMDSSMSTAPGYYEGGGIPIEGGGIIYPSNETTPSILDGGGFDPGITTPPTQGFDRGGIETPPVPSPSEDSGDTMILPETRDAVASNLAILSLKLPEEAQVFINDRLTRTAGEVRNYVSRRAQSGQANEYRIKAVVNRDGKEIVRTHTVNLEPGVRKTVALDFDNPAVTTLALKVPSDATVRLCGNGTAAVGRNRYYATRSLEDGQVWEGYQIEVSVVRDGKTITREQTIDLVAGEMRLVSFDFAVDQVVTK